MNAKKVRAEVLDLNHGSQFVPNCVVTGSDSIDVTADSAIVVVTAGAKQKPGQTRLELAATNVAMAQTLTPQLLDSSRFRYLIGKRAGVDVGNVHGLIVGEHGDSEIPLWSSVSIGGVPAMQWRSGGSLVFDDATRTELSAAVVNAAYEIIEGKGATNLAIELSTARIIEAVLGDQHRVLPISSVQTGAFGQDTRRHR